jgi:hypothetical protein
MTDSTPTATPTPTPTPTPAPTPPAAPASPAAYAAPAASPPPEEFVLGRPDLNMATAWLLGPAVLTASLAVVDAPFVPVRVLGHPVDGEPIWWVVAAAPLLLLPAILLLQRLFCVRVDDAAVAVRRVWGRTLKVPFAEITAVEVRRGLTGRSLRLSRKLGAVVTVTGDVEGFDRLAALVAERVAAAGGAAAAAAPSAKAAAAPSGGSGVVSFLSYLAGLVGAAVLAAWAVALAWGLSRSASAGEWEPLGWAVAAGAAVPGLAWLGGRFHPGPAPGCWAAAQLALWALVPAVLWAGSTASPSAMAVLPGWAAVGYALGAAAGAAAPASRGKWAGPVVAAAAVAATLAGWAWSTRVASLPAELRGAFTLPGQFMAADAVRVPVLARPLDGRWMVYSASREGGRNGEMMLARLALNDPGHEGFDDWTPSGKLPPLAVLWSPDGSVSAVLYGTGGPSTASMRVTEVAMVYWDRDPPVRISRVLNYDNGLREQPPLPLLGWAWSPDGGLLALHCGQQEARRRSSLNAAPESATIPARVFVAGLASTKADIETAEDLRLVGWRPSDNRLVLEAVDDGGRRTAEYLRPETVDKARTAGPRPDTPGGGPARTLVPPVGRELGHSPGGRYLLGWSAADGAFLAFDHWEGKVLTVRLPEAAEELAALPQGGEASLIWSDDGADLVIPSARRSARQRIVAVSLSRGTGRIAELPVEFGAGFHWSLSRDGRKLGFLAETGSPADAVRKLRALAVEWGLPDPGEPENATAAGSPKAALPAATAAPPDARPIRRMVGIARLDAEPTADGTLPVRAVGLLPAGREATASEDLPAILWPKDDPASALVVLSARRGEPPPRKIFRVAVGE